MDTASEAAPTVADPEVALKLASGVRRQSLPEQVAIAILEAIVDRRLKPGDSLPSAGDLADEFAVSRTVVREALAELMGRGVISRGSREPVISMPGPDQLQELLRVRVSQDDIDIEALVELRLPLEVQSARLAAERRTPEQLAQIEAALDTLAAETDEKRFYVADAMFHREVAMATGNLLIPLVLDSLSGVLHEFRTEWFAKQRAAGELPGLVDEHRKVFDAIRAGDPEAAGSAMATHLLAGLERIRSKRRPPA